MKRKQRLNKEEEEKCERHTRKDEEGRRKLRKEMKI